MWTWVELSQVTEPPQPRQGWEDPQIEPRRPLLPVGWGAAPKACLTSQGHHSIKASLQLLTGFPKAAVVIPQGSVSSLYHTLPPPPSPITQSFSSP